MRTATYINKITIVGLLLTLAVAFTSNFYTSTGFKLTLVVTLIGSLITLILNSHQQLAKISVDNNENMNRLILDSFGLKELTSKDEDFKKRFIKLAQLWEKLLKENVHPFLREIAIQGFEDYIDRTLVHISAREYVVEASNPLPIHAIIDYAEENIYTVNLASAEWWKSSIGKNYLEKNLQALKRGIQIIRVFVLGENDYSSFSPIIEEMYKVGIQIKIVREADLPEELKKGYVIGDGKMCQITEYDLHNNPIRYTFFDRPEKINEVNRNFKRLLNHYSTDYVPPFNSGEC